MPKLPKAPPLMNYYKLLGVSPGATPAQIRRAFLSRSKSLHPDKVTNGPKDPKWAAATRAFQDLNEAYTILRDGESRSRYDAYRHASASQPSASSTKSTRPTGPLSGTRFEGQMVFRWLLFLAYFRQLSPSNQGGLLVSLVLVAVYFFLQFLTIWDFLTKL